MLSVEAAVERWRVVVVNEGSSDDLSVLLLEQGVWVGRKYADQRDDL